MRRSVLASAIAIAGLGASALTCLPTLPPDWLVDHPTILGIKPVVVAVGPFAAPLSDDPPGVTRADGLPGDQVRLTALVVDGDGPLDLDALRPIWIHCFDDCEFYIAGGGPSPVPTCSPAVEALVPLCRFGDGASAIRTLSSDAFDGGLATYDNLFVVIGTPDGPTSEVCLSKLLSRQVAPLGDLFGCLYVSRRIGFGPAKIALAIAEIDGADTLADADPNYNPVIDHLRITLDGPAGRRTLDVADGAQIDVDPGDRAVVVVVPTEASAQEYSTYFQPDLREERFDASWFLSVELKDVDVDDERLEHRWRVPVGARGEFDEYVVLRDGRASLEWARLRWRVRGEGG